MAANLDLIRRTYDGSSDENGKNLLAVFSPGVEWTEAAGFPYAGAYVGVDALMQGVFHRLATEWEGYRADVHAYLEEGDKVAAFGVYFGRYKATGKSMTASFARLYEIRDGRIMRMTQYVDSVMVLKALS